MAYRIANADTTLSSATGWDTVTNTMTLHASTAISVTGTIYTSTFTAPNLTNACTGVAFLLINKGGYSAGNLTITVTLQENSIDTAATSTITINTTGLVTFTENTWIYFRFPSAYTFTSTTAGYYRFKITRSASATSNPTFRADSGGSNAAFMATDDRTGALASTDNLLVLGINYADTTVTWDGTQTIGSGLGTGFASIPSSSATALFGLYIGSHGIVVADTAASVTTSCKGNLVISWGGSFLIGDAGTEYPNNITFKWIFTPTVTGDYALVSYNGTVAFYGAAKSSTTLWKTTYASGVGTAANPLIVADSVDWQVNDEIYICSTGDSATNFNEGEYRFIKTKNSPTSYVLSSTVGGAEAALTYTHTTEAYILNIERNIVFKTDNTARSTSLHFNTTAITGAPNFGSSILKWVRGEILGNSGSYNYSCGITFVTSADGTYTFDYCVAYNLPYCGYYGANNYATVTINGFICCKGGSNYMLYGQAMANKTFNDLFLVDGSAAGLTSYGSNCTFNRMVINAVRKTGASTTAGALYLSLGSNIEFNDCEIGACGTAIALGSSSSDVRFNNCVTGIKGNNAFDIAGSLTYHAGIMFNNCTFGSTNFWNTTANYTYTSLIAGSEILFHNRQLITNNHSWYTHYGIASACGSGLSDTLVRTPGSLNVRIAPQNASSGFSWAFLIPANVNQVVPFSGYFLKNVAMGTDVCTVSLFLPGNPITGTPDATATLSDNVSNAWTGSAVQAVSLAAYYTGTVDAFATVVINAKSTTAGAYLYCADFYNSGDSSTLYDKLAGLTIWEKGKPSPIITQLSLGGIAPAVWGVATSALTTPGTTGKKLKDSLTLPQFMALK